MSGPKLSAYELEQMRKAELERIQREIVRIKALAMQDIQEAQRGKLWCVEECQRLDYQKQLLDSSTLSSSEKQHIAMAIQQRVSKVKALQKLYAAVQTNVIGSSLDEVQREQSAISSQLSGCRAEKSAYESGRSSYEASLSKVAEDLCKAVRSEHFSLEKALANLPPRPAKEDDLRDEKSELITRAQAIINHTNSSAADKVRAVKAINRINETKDPRELRELRSLVIGEIERTIRKTEPLIEEYQQLLATKNALSASLGVMQPEDPQPFADIAELRQLISKTKAQIKKLEAKLLEEAERAEIARCIDLAMEELGYDFIGKKRSENGSSQIKLFEFNDSTGLQVIHRQDGVVRIKVVGLANEDKQPTEQEQEALYQEQVQLCDEYDEIVEAFRRKGVVMRAGTEKRNPAHRQFSQFVNVSEYSTSYTAAETPGKAKRRERRAARKPKVLSKQ